MKGYRKKLPKYAGGGVTNFIGNNSNALMGGANFLGDTLDAFNTSDTPNAGGIAMGAVSSGLKGAAAGTAILPGVGTAIGAGIGLVSGVIGGIGKRKAGLAQQLGQRKAYADAYKRQSDQTLMQYDSNGVDTQLYADGGIVPPIDTLVKSNPLLTNGKLMVQKADGSIGQWGNAIPTNSPAIPKVNPPIPISDKGRNLSNTYYPARYTRQGPEVPIQRPSANYYRYAYGGNIGGQYEAEKGEVVQGNPQLEESTEIASDLHQVGGNSHEQGGTVGSGGERIFSDRLKISKDLADILDKNGIKVKSKSTYADVSNKIGKLKGKFEDKKDATGVNTARVMLPRLEQHLDTVFNDQEMGKAYQSYKKYSKGGMIKYDGGGNVYKGVNPSIFADRSPLLELQAPANMYSNFQQPVVLNPVSSPYTSNDSFLNRFGKSVGQVAGQVGDYVSENSGQVMNAANYVANLGSIGKLDTTVNPQYLSSPNYNYTDKSGAAYNRNNSLLKTGVKSLTNAGRTVSASNVGALYSKNLEANSTIADNENTRRDRYNESYNQRADKINGYNSQVYNEAQSDSRDLRNQKVSLRLGARNAFQQGIIGNQAMKQQAELDDKKLMTVLAGNDSNGVMTRYLQNIPKYKKLLKDYKSSANN